MKRCFKFLFSIVDQDQELVANFFRDLKSALLRCEPPAEISLLTTSDYRVTILNEKLQRCYVICNQDALPLLAELLKQYPAVEVPPPDIASYTLLETTARGAMANTA